MRSCFCDVRLKCGLRLAPKLKKLAPVLGVYHYLYHSSLEPPTLTINLPDPKMPTTRRCLRGPLLHG